MKHLPYSILAILMALYLQGCVSDKLVDQLATNYESVAPQIAIGDAKTHVLGLLKASQNIVPSSYKKKPERYLSYGEPLEIHFVRTSLHSGGDNADEDFTPYVFRNEVLVSVGWRYVSKSEFHDKSLEAISAGGVKPDQDVLGDNR